MIPRMSQSTELTESAPDSSVQTQIETGTAPEPAPGPAKAPGRRVRRRGPAAPKPAPDASKAETVVAQARQLLERLVRSGGFGWRDIDRLIHKNRGFTAHLLSKREGLPLNELLEILDVIDVKYEDFFAVLFPRFDKPRFKKPIGAGLVDLMSEFGVPEAPADPEADQDERARELWGRLDKINALIDRRVLALMEQALGEPVQLPRRPEAPADPGAPNPAVAGEGGPVPVAAKDQVDR
jgi:hypothetical protein